MAVPGRFKKEREGKHLATVEKMRHGKNCLKEKREIQPIQRGNGSHRRAEHLKTYENCYSLRYCDFFANTFPPLMWVS